MGNFNRVFLMGNLTRDVELRSTNSGHQVAKFGLAVNRRWRDQNGQDKEETTFVDCEAWSKTAETLAKYLSKGKPIFIEGRLKLDQWTDKESGQNRSKLGVVVETFQFIDSKGGGGGGGEGGGGSYNRPNVVTRGQSRPAPAAQQGGSDGGSQEVPESDDIPF